MQVTIMILNIIKKSTEYVNDIKSILTLSKFDRSTPDGRSRERYRLIIMSAITNFGAKAFTSLVGMVSVPLTLHYMGVEIYGLWMIISSLVVWLQLSDFGISNGLINALTESYGKKDYNAARKYISSSIVFLSSLTLVSIIPAYFLAFYLPWEVILNVDNIEYINILKKCFFVASVFFLVSMPVSIVSKIFIAYQLGYVANLLQVLVSLISLGMVIVSILLKLSIIWFVSLISVAPVVGNLILWVVFFRVMPWFSFEGYLLNGITRVMRSSIPLFVFQIVALIINNLTNVIISNRSNLTLVAEYNIYNKVYMLIFFVGTSIAMPFYPAIREAMIMKDFSWVHKSIKRVLSIRMVIVFLCAMPFIFFGDTLVELWARHSIVYPLEKNGWVIVAICLAVITVGSTFSEILLYNDIIWPQIAIATITAIILIVCLYVLIPIYGIKSVYLSFIIANIHPIIWGYEQVKRWYKKTNSMR